MGCCVPGDIFTLYRDGMKSSKSGRSKALRSCWFIFCSQYVPFNGAKQRDLLVTGKAAERFEEENKKEDVS